MNAQAIGFPPVVGAAPTVLILGSMPGQRSLQAQQYYAHPRNAFWPIMQAVFGIDTASGYGTRVNALAQAGVALWDVLGACERPGSLDADIDADTAITNDFAGFFANHAGIERVLFNGGAAERYYLRRVLPALANERQALPRLRLPSTSPAYAAMRFEQKLAHWRRALEAA